MRPWSLSIVVALLLDLTLGAWAGGNGADTVMLDSGPVRGRTQGETRAFLGIPYASPPVGDLRWRPPRPVTPWTTALDAVAYGRACPQTGPLEADSGEDCLTLNVWTPARNAGEKLPVMVWIHGGGFNFGASSQPEYDGRNLASKGVVVVTVNYRLGPLGFLVHPRLNGEDGRGVSGNFGLLDQIAALQWVRRNITAFGGDPGLVTIFGQSAGSRSVSLLTLSPPAAGLFQRAIAQSGGPIMGSEYLNPAFNGDMENVSKMGQELGSRLGCDKADDPVACMRAKPAMEIVKAADCRTGLFDDGLFFAPVFDGRVLPRDARAAFASGQRADAPMILGSTGDEGTTYLRGEQGLTLDKYRSFLEARFGPDTDAALAVFPAQVKADVPRAINKFITVAVNAQPARFVARSLEGKPSKAYLYSFIRRPDTQRARQLGAFHGVDLAYVFGNMADSDGYTALDRELSRQVMAYWVNFARTGDPNGPGLPHWPAYESTTGQSLEFGDAVRTRQRLYQEECDFIDRMSRFGPGK